MKCARCHSVLERGDLRCPVCALEPERPTTSEEVTTKVLRCQECHAALEYSATLEKAQCSFCGATLELEYSTDPLERAEGFVPFAIDKGRAVAALKTWLGGRGFFAPGDLASQAHLDALSPVGWSAWVVNGQALATYGADCDSLGRKADYGPLVGQLARSLSLIVPATKGLTLEEVDDLGAYDVSTAQPEPEPQVACEDFGVTRTSARQRIIAGVKADAAAALAQLQRGRELRDVKIDVMLTALETKRLVLPVWVMAYRYGKKRYRVVVHGQNGAVVGSSPTSLWRVLAAVGGALGLIVVLLALLELASRLS